MIAPARLSHLNAALDHAPVRPSAMIGVFDSIQEVAWLRETVERLLPQHAAHVLGQESPQAMAQAFSEKFAQEHFPIRTEPTPWVQDESPMETLIWGIPVIPQGLDEEEIHLLWSTGERENDCLGAMAMIAAPPGTWMEMYQDDGHRIAWLDAARGAIPRETLERIPQGGIPISTIQQALQGTPLEPVSDTVGWVYAQTGNFFLDTPPTEDNQEVQVDWTQENIEELTREWREAERILEGVGRTAEWLAADLPGRFAPMLDFILERASCVPGQPLWRDR